LNRTSSFHLPSNPVSPVPGKDSREIVCLLCPIFLPFPAQTLPSLCLMRTKPTAFDVSPWPCHAPSPPHMLPTLSSPLSGLYPADFFCSLLRASCLTFLLFDPSPTFRPPDGGAAGRDQGRRSDSRGSRGRRTFIERMCMRYSNSLLGDASRRIALRHDELMPQQ